MNLDEIESKLIDMTNKKLLVWNTVHTGWSCIGYWCAKYNDIEARLTKNGYITIAGTPYGSAPKLMNILHKDDIKKQELREAMILEQFFQGVE